MTESEEVKRVISNFGRVDLNPYRITDYDNRDYIPFGSDNLFPQATALLGRSSPNHRGVINSKVNYYMGDGLQTEDKRLLPLLDEANFEGEPLDSVVERLLLDDEMGGNSYLEIITDRNRNFFWFNQIDYTKVRLSKDLQSIILYPDWKKYINEHDENRKTLPLYPNFVTERNEYGRYVSRSVIHLKRYEPEFTFYGLPRWVAGRDNIEIDFKTNRWNLARLENSFRLSGIMVVPVKDKNEAEAVLTNIEKAHIGEGNNNKLLTITKSRAREGEKADTTQFIETKQDDQGSWLNLINMSMTQTIVSHSWFRSLLSLPDNTGFDTSRILNEYEIALNTVITKRQKEVISVFEKVFREQAGIAKLDLSFKNNPPLKDFTYMYIWEARKARGLDFDENKPEQQGIIIEKTTEKGASNG